MGNAALEQLADNGDGNYAYIDTLDEAKKVLVDGFAGTLVTVAKDVKAQIEMNPRLVSSYRLVGYENRALAREDFNDDSKDAGDVGAGHSVTALYEIVPAKEGAVDALVYQPTSGSNELLTVKLRYKPMGSDKSELISVPLTDHGKRFESASTDFRFAAAVALYGMGISGSEHRGIFDLRELLQRVQTIALGSQGTDRNRSRAGFLDLVRKTQRGPMKLTAAPPSSRVGARGERITRVPGRRGGDASR